jgi:hypothetical protein
MSQSDEKPIEGIKPDVAAAKERAMAIPCANCGDLRSAHIIIHNATIDEGTGTPPIYFDTLICPKGTYKPLA